MVWLLFLNRTLLIIVYIFLIQLVDIPRFFKHKLRLKIVDFWWQKWSPYPPILLHMLVFHTCKLSQINSINNIFKKIQSFSWPIWPTTMPAVTSALCPTSTVPLTQIAPTSPSTFTPRLSSHPKTSLLRAVAVHQWSVPLRVCQHQRWPGAKTLELTFRLRVKDASLTRRFRWVKSVERSSTASSSVTWRPSTWACTRVLRPIRLEASLGTSRCLFWSLQGEILGLNWSILQGAFRFDQE